MATHSDPHARLRRRRQFRLMALMLGLLVGLVVLEAGLRIFFTVTFKFPFERLSPKTPNDRKREVALGEMVRSESDPLLLCSLKPNMTCKFNGFLVQTNALGLRDDKLEEKTSHTLRLLGLGDSTMFGWGVPKETCYLELLEAELQHLVGERRKVECINTGVPSYNAVQELQTFIKFADRIKPDAVLIQFDKNDNQPNDFYLKPDYLRAPVPILAHPWLLLRGFYTAPAAIYLLGEAHLAQRQRPEMTGWEAQQRAYRKLAELCSARHIPLLAMIVFEDRPKKTTLPDKIHPEHKPLRELCRELKIPLIDGRRTADAWLLKQNRKFANITFGANDLHPTMQGHALLAQAALPAVARALLGQAGISTATLPGYATLGNTALRQLSMIGMGQIENWNGTRVNWTSGRSHLKFIPGGKRLIVPFLVNGESFGDGKAKAKVLKVQLRVDGTADPRYAVDHVFREFTYEKAGFYREAVEIGELHGEQLDLSIDVSRTWSTSNDSRQLGVALYGLEFE